MSSGSWGLTSNAYAHWPTCEGGWLQPAVMGRPDAARVVVQRRALRGKRLQLVTPFAGKAFCLADYLRGIRRLPLRRVHATWYDNSCDRNFRRRLVRALESHFASYTLIEDRHPPATIETTDDYGRVDDRVCAIYRCILENHLERLPYVLVVEDDVSIPACTWERLERVLSEEPSIATVVGSMNARRIAGDLHGAPVAWTMERVETIGGDWSVRAQLKRMIVEKPLGIELIAAAHTGCWLTRTSVVKQLGIRQREDAISFVDQVWGYRLHKAGLRMAIDWSVKTRHYYMQDGNKKYV